MPKSSTVKPAIPPFINFLQKRIKEDLEDSTIIINEIYQGTGNYSIVSGSGLEFHTEEETGHTVGIIPMLITDSVKYWFSLNIAINSSTKTVKGLSIGVYSDNSLSKLFRAEWSANETKLPHAQPHWHIHTAAPYIQPNWDEGNQEMEFIGEVEDIDVYTLNIKDIHFAMYAGWHKNENSHVELISDYKIHDIVNWTSGTLNYIITQLKYLYNKSKLTN